MSGPPCIVQGVHNEIKCFSRNLFRIRKGSIKYQMKPGNPQSPYKNYNELVGVPQQIGDRKIKPGKVKRIEATDSYVINMLT